MEEEKTPFQELLSQAFLDFIEKRGEAGVRELELDGPVEYKIEEKDTIEFAKWLGVNHSSFIQWINGNEIPDVESARVLAERLGPDVFDILGYK